TPGARALMSYLLSRYPRMRNGGIYNCRRIAGSSALSLHACGTACDVMTGTGSPTTESKILAEQLRLVSENLGVHRIIHNRQDWFSNGPLDWTPYGGSNPHRDHVHIELTRDSSRFLTVSAISKILWGPSPDGNDRSGAYAYAKPDGESWGRYGDNPWYGGAVKRLQRRLNAHGFSLVEDAMFGPKTERATEVFQSLVGIAVDGIAGKVTFGRLG